MNRVDLVGRLVQMCYSRWVFVTDVASQYLGLDEPRASKITVALSLKRK